MITHVSESVFNRMNSPWMHVRVVRTASQARVELFTVFEKLVSVIAFRILRFPTGNIYYVCTLEPRLSFGCICSVGFFHVFEVIVKNSLSKVPNSQH